MPITPSKLPRSARAIEIAAIRARHGELPVLAAGMIGSTRGWIEVPYLACPSDLPALAAGLHWVEPGRTAIVPGLCWQGGGRADVMRGEEVQLLGAVAAGLVPGDGLLCQPGTHCKWARLSGGAVGEFRTRMTGELFALLRRHSLLATMIDGPVMDGPAFRAGVADAAAGDLLGALFGIRAAVLTGRSGAADSACYASGLMIGSDVAAQRLAPDDRVYLLADAVLGGLYQAAIEHAGGQVVPINSEAAFTAAAAALFRQVAAFPHRQSG
jgi:2-dehydro-3-deoxygalactonokinase